MSSRCRTRHRLPSWIAAASVLVVLAWPVAAQGATQRGAVMSGDQPIRDSQVRLYATGGVDGPRELARAQTRTDGSFELNYDDDLAKSEIRYLIAEGPSTRFGLWSSATPGHSLLRLSPMEGRGGWEDRYGNYVVIDHGNKRRTTYAHLDDVFVGHGSVPSRGTVIATAGCTGTCTGPHLHFEVRINGVPKDPLRYLP